MKTDHTERDLEKAKRLLAMLRMRTEDRGATPAEAAQAATLAEKIAQRYGLGIGESSDGESEFKIAEKRMPEWAKTLAWSVSRRFGIDSEYSQMTGHPVQIRFLGPEHLTGVAVWLFNAIRSDLDKRSYIAGRAMNQRGPGLLRFRNKFRQTAAFEIEKRLNPGLAKAECDAVIKSFSAEELAEIDAKFERRMARKKCRPIKQRTDAELERMNADEKANRLGRAAGQEIAIDTSVIGEKTEPRIRLEHAT